jgi:eukaryotic-like serine/threonine-protein kinase
VPRFPRKSSYARVVARARLHAARRSNRSAAARVLEMSCERNRIGPYEVMELVSEGGTGRVYRCLHMETREVAAVKIPRSASAYEREALRRETAALDRLSRHRYPGVIRLISYGMTSEDGVPWYAMEHIDGRDLDEVRRELWAPTTARTPYMPSRPGSDDSMGMTIEATRDVVLDAPARETQDAESTESLACVSSSGQRPDSDISVRGRFEAILELGAGIAESLDLVHSEGVVHGDLTPRNVLVRAATGQPVLVDFGTAFQPQDANVARELPHVLSRFGTAAYAAPEKIRGEPVDARGDLYGLGCILYELLTDRRPWQGMADASRHCAPRSRPWLHPPSHYNRVVPPPLDALIARLLADDPMERLGRAIAAARLLRSMLGTLQDRPETLHRSVPLYRSRLIDREPTIEQFDELLSAAARGAGGLAVIVGESGIGKTRFVNEVSARAVARGVSVISTHCGRVTMQLTGTTLGTRSLEPFLPFFEHVADRCADSRYRHLLSDLQKDLANVASYASCALDALKIRPPPKLSPEHERVAVLRSVPNIIRRCAKDQRVLLVFDDLQWADELTLDVLKECASNLRDSHALVLATYRAEEVNERLKTLTDSALFHVTLDRLSLPAIQTMAMGMLGVDNLAAGLAAFLYEQSEGNPFFAAEYLRAVLMRGWLDERATPEWQVPPESGVAMPRSLTDLLALRIAGLSAQAVATLQLASVLGREFDSELLTAMPDGAELSCPASLEELVARQLLEWVGPGRYRFAHHKLRDAQEEALSPELRRQLHRIAAIHLERVRAEWAGAIDTAQLGIHWASAGEPSRALEYLESAAAAAHTAHTPGRATELYRLALQQAELVDDGGARAARLAALTEGLGDALVAQARHGEARPIYERAALLLSPSQRLARARVHRKRAASYWILHDYENSEKAHEQALWALGPPDVAVSEVVREYIEIQIGRLEQLYFSRKIGTETERMIEDLRPLVATHASIAQRCYFSVGAACELAARRRYAFSSEALDLARMAVPEDPHLLPVGQLALARLTVGFMQLAGDEQCCREGARWLEQAELDATAAGDSTLLCRVVVYRMLAALRLAHVDETHHLACRVLRLAQTVQQPPYVAAARACDAWAAWRVGQAAKAENLATKALETWTAHSHAYPFQWTALFPLVDIHIAAERFDVACGLLTRLLHPSQQVLPDPLVGLVSAALTANTSGRPADFQRSVRAMFKTARSFGYC